MRLVLEMEYLSGVSYAAVGPDTDVSDWPPQPDRVFSALVATWAARGQRDEETTALQWLESLPAPRVEASEATPRSAPIVFVPPNDPRSDKKKSAMGVMPALRSRQPRRFPAVRPHDSVVRLLWDSPELDPKKFEALEKLASDTAYVGHSASLTRCRFLRIDDEALAGVGKPPRRRIYAGRFDELRRDFEIGGRPLPGAPVSIPAPSKGEHVRSLFDNRWLLLEHIAGEMPNIRACAIVAKTIRDALLSGYRQIGREAEIPEVICGHTPDGSPTRSPHLAIVPLAFAGFAHSDGHVMGFALVPPRGNSILDDEVFRNVLRRIAPIDEQRGRRVLTTKPKEGTAKDQTFCLDFSPTFEPAPDKRSLDPAPYIAVARTWGTVTPIVLDRHLKQKGEARQEEIAKQLAAACRNIDLPEPITIVADKHSAVDGAVSAIPSRASPSWMRWRMPDLLASRQLTHAVFAFSEPVQGPLILCAGRYLGLGLCRRID